MNPQVASDAPSASAWVTLTDHKALVLESFSAMKKCDVDVSPSGPSVKGRRLEM